MNKNIPSGVVKTVEELMEKEFGNVHVVDLGYAVKLQASTNDIDHDPVVVYIYPDEIAIDMQVSDAMDEIDNEVAAKIEEFEQKFVDMEVAYTVDVLESVEEEKYAVFATFHINIQYLTPVYYNWVRAVFAAGDLMIPPKLSRLISELEL